MSMVEIKFRLANQDILNRIIAYLSSLDLTTPKIVSIVDEEKFHTDPQRRLYWKWIDVIRMELGHDKDALHQDLLEKFTIPKVLSGINGPREKYSLNFLGKKAMSQYMDDVSRLAAEYNILLPKDI